MAGRRALLQILALIMPLRMVATLLPPVLWGIGRPGVSATNVLIAAAVIPWACLIGAQWGAAGWPGVAHGLPGGVAITLRRAGEVLGLGTPDFRRAMQAPALASLAMAAVVIGTRYLLPDQRERRAPACCARGAVTYLVRSCGAGVGEMSCGVRGGGGGQACWMALRRKAAGPTGRANVQYSSNFTGSVRLPSTTCAPLSSVV